MKTNPNYFTTLEEFIAFYEAIPEDKWLKDQLQNNNKPGCHCAIGHLGVTFRLLPNLAAQTLYDLIDSEDTNNYPLEIAYANNGYEYGSYNELGNSPKERVLNYLALKVNGLV